MPELPDVEYFKSKIKKVIHKKIQGFTIHKKTIIKTSYKTLDQFVGHQFTSIERYGKYLFLTCNKKYLLLHFGMTGNVRYFKKDEDPPKYSAIDFLFTSKNLAVISKRKLGEILILDSKKKFIEKKELGPDALSVKKNEFLKILNYKKGTIKSFFLNQSAIAGIGNIYGDEILFHAGVKPNRKIQSLTNDEKEKIYEKMKKVLKKAVENLTREKPLPSTWLTENRKKNKKCPKCKGKIKTITISGRTGYYCSNCQS